MTELHTFSCLPGCDADEGEEEETGRRDAARCVTLRAGEGAEGGQEDGAGRGGEKV